MLRKIAIALAAAAIALGGSTLSTSAHRGGGGGGMHGGGGGGMHGGGGPHGGGGRYVMRDHGRDHWRDHWRGRHGYRDYTPYRRYSYGGSCWRWTPEGRTWVCGGYGPSYRY